MGRFRNISFIVGENTKPAFEPVSFGIDEIDKALDGGLYPGLTLIGGAPDMGQNDLLLTLAVTAARSNDEKQGIPVLLFSGEVTDDIIRLRLVSRETADAAEQNDSPMKAVSTVLLVNGSGVQKQRYADKAREKLERECAENIYVVEGTNRDIMTETGLFMKETGKKPLVAVYGIKSFKRGGEAMTTETNMSDLVSFLYGNSLCCAASCTLDKGRGESIDRLAFRDAGVSCVSADVLLAVISSFAAKGSKASAAPEESSDTRHVALAVLKRSFGGISGSRIRLDFRPKYSYIAPHKERSEKTRKFIFCRYNNSDLSNNRVFRSTTLVPDESEKFGIKWDDMTAEVTYRLYTDTGEPIKFGSESGGNRLIFDYFDLMLCDAVYTASGGKKRTKLDLAFIYGILTGRRGRKESRVTDERLIPLMQSIARLALTKIKLEIKKTTGVSEGDPVTVIERPLLPLDKAQTDALRECYMEYRNERSKSFGELLNDDRNGEKYIDAFINKVNKRRYISLTDEMPLFEFADKTGQIKSYPNELQYIPSKYRERSNENFLMVKHFLIKRLEWVRRHYSDPSQNKRTHDIHNIWFLESSGTDRAAGLCSRIGYGKPDRIGSSDDPKQFRERFRQIHEMAKAVLNYYTDIGYIYGFEDYYGKDGIRPGTADRPDYKILVGVSLLPEDPDDPKKTYVRDPKTDLDWKTVDKLLTDENNGKTSDEDPENTSDKDVKA